MSAGTRPPDTKFDCLIVGGGPAGLTAAIYAARFHLKVAVLDAGDGRALQIPCTRNHAGFPGGISGAALLGRMRDQALEFGVAVHHEHVQTLTGRFEDFTAQTSQGSYVARTVLLCTGVTNLHPEGFEVFHAEALAQGRLRYCAVCDGYEVTDKNLAVIGSGSRAAKEAEFLRSYTDHVTLIPVSDNDGLTRDDRLRLAAVGVEIADAPASAFTLVTQGLALVVGDRRLVFDAVYPALGSIVHSKLAAALGAALADDGCIKVDAHQRTTVEGLYAAGDVVTGLDQISHAMGEAGVAATSIRNDLAVQAPRLRKAQEMRVQT